MIPVGPLHSRISDRTQSVFAMFIAAAASVRAAAYTGRAAVVQGMREALAAVLGLGGGGSSAVQSTMNMAATAAGVSAMLAVMIPVAAV